MNHIYIQKLLLFFLFFNFFSTEILIGQELTASQGDNDAYIDVAWDLDKNDCLTDDNNNPFFNGVFLQLLGNGQEIYSEIITDVSGIGTSYVSSYRHEVGPNTTVNYTIKIFERGPGTLRCFYSASGSTVAFMPPVIELVSNSTSPDSIFIRWNNPSSLVNSFNLLRDNVVIGTFPALNGPGEVFSFRDGYVVNGDNSLQNGQTHVYCIKSFSHLTSNLPSICGNGSTIDLGFVASDDAFTDKVELTWNNMSTFADNIQVVRNGVTIKTLSNDVTTYPDNSPIYGQKSNYGIVLIRNNTSVVDDFDIGSVPKNGLISGKVLTEADLFPVKGATVKIEGMAGDSIILDSIKTDFAGCFSFPDLYYGMETNFTLTVRKNNSTFASATKNITLNSATPQNTSTLFYQKIGFTDAEENIEISNFVVTPQNGQDKVDLSWEYTPLANDTTFFNIYRNSNIIARMNDANGAITTFTDLKGVPNTNHTYSLVIFRIDEANGSVIDGIVSAPAIFPAVAPVSQLNLFANNTLGRVDLNWGASHSSSNYQGFRVYRNDIFLAEVPVGTFSYLDLTGESGMTYTYKVTAKRTLDEVDYESTPTTHSNAVIYPVLPEPINFSASPASDNKDYVRVVWTIPSNITTDYNYTGFRVYRSLGGQNDFEQIGSIDKGAAPAPNSQVSYFNDLTGLPNVAYDYQVSLYLEVSDTTYQSSTPVLSATFPAVKPPANFLATGGANKIDLTWDAYHSTPTSEFINQNGFILNRNGEFLVNIPVGQNSYTDYVNNPPHTTDVTYELKAVRTIAGQDYFSTIATAAATPMGNGDNSPTIPSNFTASSDIPNHIKLCWEYPEFAFSEFIIKRDGQTIASLPRTARSYYDYDAPKAPEVIYSIQADYQGDLSQEALAVGRLMYFRTISGRVQRVNSGEGVPNVLIHATSATNGIDYYQQATTDAAGYYSLTDIPCDVADIQLNVLGAGSDFDADVNQTNPQTSATVSVNVAQDDYIQNFTDYYLPAYANDEIAIPTQVTATPDPTKMGVLVSWSPKNPNYSGFEIYRGTGVIKEVLAGEPLSHLDTEGTAGINYSYNVRAFWDTNSGRQYSNTVGRTAIFPKLEPVINLTATPNISRNSMSLNWSHIYDSHDFYIIKRNDVVIGTVETGNPLMFSDTTGQPGQTYDYALTAAKGVSLSEKTIVREIFPTTDYPRNLAVTIPPSPTNTSNNQNKVLLSWSYSTGAADGFEIYRNGQKISEVADNQNSYEDFSGIPLANTTYSVVAFVERGGNRYTSRDDITVSLTTYPVIAFPENVIAQANISAAAVDINWSYPTTEGVDGFYIERVLTSNNAATRIHTLFVDDSNSQAFSYTDKGGIPSTSYHYVVEAFSFRMGQEYVSNQVQVPNGPISPAVVYPNLPTPSVFPNGNIANSVTIAWSYNNDIEPDGFEVKRGNTLLANVDGGIREYTDILSTSGNHTYSVRAFKNINGGRYYSSAGTTVTGPNSFLFFNPETATGFNPNDFLGQDVAIDGNWMVVGLPHSMNENGQVYIYEFVESSGIGKWILHSTFQGGVQEQFGFSVDISGDRIVVGKPYNSFFAENAGGYAVLKRNGNTWSYEANVTYNTADYETGYDVAIDGNRLILGAPGDQRIIFWEYNGTDWVAPPGTVSFQLSTPGNFGFSVDIDGDYAVIGAPTTENDQGAAYIWHRETNGWTPDWGIDSPVAQNDVNFGYDVSIEGDRVLIGTVGFSTPKVGFFFTRNTSGPGWTLEDEILRTELNSSSNGASVHLEGDAAIIGAFSEVIGGQAAVGAAYLYRQNGNDWQQQKRYVSNLNQSLILYGRSVALSGKHIGVGAPNFGGGISFQGSGKIYNYFSYDFITSVTASDGDFDNRTQINWTFDGDDSYIDDFNIHRDGVIIETVDKSDRSYQDLDGVPGKEYLYSVSMNFTDGLRSQTVSDNGYRNANGVLAGQVSTLQGGSPVQGVTITAEAMIDNNYHHYETTTNVTGSFSIPNVYYGEGDALYIVSPALEGHDFQPDFQEVTLNAQLNQNTAISFLDKRAFIIKGTVNQLDNVCGLDSIKVTVTSVRNNNTESVMNTFSDENGNYSFAVNPNDIGLDSIIVAIENFRVINRNSVMADTIYHDFLASAQRIFTTSDFANFPIETTIDFIDNLTYPVEILVQNTCEIPISSDLWTIRARTIDGCFDQSYQTQNTGKVTLSLPPLDYEISVTAVDNPTVPNLTALSYFENKKAKLDLYTLHKDSSRVISPEDFNDLTKRSFTFHKAPTITLTSGFSKFFCDDPNKSAIISQNNNYTLRFGVTENHNNNNCSVKEGFIKVTNAASDNPDAVMLHYDKDANAFPAYTFTAGKPNLIEPHFYVMEVAYFSANGDFLGNKNMVVFVEGTAGVPGTDVVVNPEQGDQVQYPLFVLRDPPGDGSSASIAEGSQINKSFNLSQTEDGSFSYFDNSEIKIFGVGGNFGFNASVGGGGQQAKDWSYSVTTSQKISTSSSPYNTGRNADVMVGVGLAMQYGLIQDLRAGECDTIYQTTRFGFTPNKVNTTWVYTVEQIEGIITQFRNDSLAVEAGTREYSEGGIVFTKEDAIKRLEVYISNWEKVMEYHDIQTLPHYTLCTRGQYNHLPIAHKNAIYDWQDAFCTRIGSYQGDIFNINDPETITWDNTLVDLYNAAGTAIRNLSDSIPNPGAPLVWQYDENNPLSQYADAQYDAQFGILAENYTFGGAATIDKSLSTAQTSTKSFSSSVNFGFGLDISLTFGNETTFVLAPFGVGTLQKVADLSFTAGLKTDFKYTISESRSKAETQTVDISYTLEDNDVGDQFSVTAIQGPSQNHTPYFSLLGGRSSCPPEAGTIVRDDAILALVDPTTGATTNEMSMYDVPEGDAATFIVKLTNNNIFDENRNLFIALDNASNTNGAIVRLAGSLLGSQTFFNVGPGGENAVFLPLTIERGLVGYNHSIRIGLQPFCADGVTGTYPLSYITLNVTFENPCTPITIVSPDDNWVINTTNGNLVVTIRDYQPENPPLQNVRLQYRRIGSGADFDDIPLRHMKDLDAFVTAADLQAHNAMIPLTEIPEYFFIWELPTDEFDLYPDGEYELRVKAQCSNSETTSNVILGTINRSGLRLFGTPEPADGLWTSGDEISFSFNKNLDCNLMTPSFVAANFSMIDKSNGDALVPFEVACLNNKLVFLTSNPMSDYDGHDLEVVLNDVKDANGNGLTEPVTWQFHVITQKVYWEKDTISLELYQGESVDITIQLENSTSVETVSGLSLGVADNTIEDNWLSFAPSTNFSVNPSGRTITLTITSENIATYSDILQVNGLAGRIPELYIEATFKPKPPYWEVEDPAQYNSSMSMIANWYFEDLGNSMTSIDTLDMISVWMDNEIRGVAKITAAGNGFYAAYIAAIYGQNTELDKDLEVRIWDADEGNMYIGTPTTTSPLQFQPNVNIGSTPNPELMEVNRTTDLIREIPLNQGWTWFSINAEQADMTLNELLGSLKVPQTGDIIKTEDGSAIYEDGLGWVSLVTDPLETMSVENGYMIRLEGGSDTLLLTGTAATLSDQFLTSGWNWIGYPRAISQNVNSVISFTPAIDDGSILKVIRQDGTAALADYNNGTWTGSLTELRPFDGYKIKVENENSTILGWDLNTPFSEEETEFAQNRMDMADPMDETTWIIDGFDYEYVMPLVAQIELSGDVMEDSNDQVAIFVGNDLRGTGKITFIPALNRYEVSFLVGGIAINETLEIYFYDASADRVFSVNETLALTDEGYGNFSDPHIIPISIFNIDIDKQDVVCSSDNNGSITLEVSQGLEPYSFEWSTGSDQSSLTGLGVGIYTVTITDATNYPVELDVEIVNTAESIPGPAVTPDSPIACQGSSVTLSASNPTHPNASFSWYNANGNLLQNGSTFTLNNIQTSQTIRAYTQVNGACLSDPKEVVITMEAWADATFTVDDRTPVANAQEITFSPTTIDPTVTYQWSFGDGTTATGAPIRHTYTTQDVFDIVLTTTTANNCGFTSFSNNYIVTDGSQQICNSTLDSDNDGWKDDCDNCPFISNALQVDDDGDFVGNVCDCDSNNAANPNNPRVAQDFILGTADVAGYYQAINVITSNGLVTSHSEFKAGQSITLGAGFETPVGFDFYAHIATCNAPAPVAGDIIVDERVEEEDETELVEIPGNDLKVIPNPVSNMAVIHYQLSEQVPVVVTVHSITGTLVETLILNEIQDQGEYEVPFNAERLEDGMYYVLLKAGDKVQTRKLVLLK